MTSFGLSLIVMSRLNNYYEKYEFLWYRGQGIEAKRILSISDEGPKPKIELDTPLSGPYGNKKILHTNLETARIKWQGHHHVLQRQFYQIQWKYEEREENRKEPRHEKTNLQEFATIYD